jgi:hypothetical protein
MIFAENAIRLSGQCAVLLGWRPQEFWDATPAELSAIIVAMAPEDAAPPTPNIISQLMEQFPDG